MNNRLPFGRFLGFSLGEIPSPSKKIENVPRTSILKFIAALKITSDSWSFKVHVNNKYIAATVDK
jgi:hypothetical protein